VIITDVKLTDLNTLKNQKQVDHSLAQTAQVASSF